MGYILAKSKDYFYPKKKLKFQKNIFFNVFINFNQVSKRLYSLIN